MTVGRMVNAPRFPRVFIHPKSLYKKFSSFLYFKYSSIDAGKALEVERSTAAYPFNLHKKSILFTETILGYLPATYFCLLLGYE